MFCNAVILPVVIKDFSISPLLTSTIFYRDVSSALLHFQPLIDFCSRSRAYRYENQEEGRLLAIARLSLKDTIVTIVSINRVVA